MEEAGVSLLFELEDIWGGVEMGIGWLEDMSGGVMAGLSVYRRGPACDVSGIGGEL